MKPSSQNSAGLVRRYAEYIQSIPIRLSISLYDKQDAAWMVAGPPLRCQTPEDVYLLLKSSDFIAHDLEHVYDDCEEEDRYPCDRQSAPPKFSLVLKKWFSMPRSHEFRCFVKKNSLIGK